MEVENGDLNGSVQSDGLIESPVLMVVLNDLAQPTVPMEASNGLSQPTTPIEASNGHGMFKEHYRKTVDSVCQFDGYLIQ